MSGFKIQGFFYQEDEFIKNSNLLQDMFSPATVSEIENNITYFKTDTFSQLTGHCFTVCSLSNWNETVGPHFYLTTKFNIKIFIHERGMELWLKGFAVFPFEVPSVIMETNNSRGMVGSLMALKQVDSIYLNKEEEPCRHYSVDSFISCCKTKLWENLRPAINCSIVELKNIIPDAETLSECENKTIAYDIYWDSAFIINSFTHKPWMFGCPGVNFINVLRVHFFGAKISNPKASFIVLGAKIAYEKCKRKTLMKLTPVPCRQLTYKILVDHYHKNNFLLHGNMMEESKNYYTLMVNNPSAIVEEQIENLEYDVVDLLASAGGNLGLFLGFSCLSVLFSAINFTANLLSKMSDKFIRRIN